MTGLGGLNIGLIWLKGGRSYSIQGCGRSGLAVLNGNEFCLYDQCSLEDELQVAEACHFAAIHS